MGWYCNYNETEPQICPPGTYCPFNSQDPLNCPKGTYNIKEGAGSIKDCFPCEGGYHCYEPAIGNLNSDEKNYKCPLGHYCPRGENIEPIPCLGGTYIDNGASAGGKSFEETYLGQVQVADNIKDCQICPEHYYCLSGTANRYEYPCPDGFLCPMGIAEPVSCPPGFYCQRRGGVMIQLECPVGYYCPMQTANPQKCDPNQVCKAGSTSASASSMVAEDCLPGEYLSIDVCVPCEPGFVCDRFTDAKYPESLVKNGGSECPAGHYCPGGSTTETAVECPAGRFRLSTGGMSVEDCYPCPDDSSNSKTGQSVCVLCGRGSTHNEDRTSCKCLGAFRTWQESTNACVCKSGYYAPVYTEET